MDIAALVTWLVTALGGFYLLGTWIARGALRNPGSSHLPAPVLLGHFLLAAAGLVIWIIYLAADKKALAWTAFALLVPAALLGLGMFERWLPSVRSRATVAPSGGTVGAAAGATAPTAASTAASSAKTPERPFPVPVVVAHGVFAVATVVLGSDRRDQGRLSTGRK